MRFTLLNPSTSSRRRFLRGLLLLPALLVLALLTRAALPALADNPDAVLGIWKNGEGTGMIQIFKKSDGKFYGRIVWLKVANNPDGTPRTDINNPDEAKRNHSLKGLENMRGFEYKGDNKWEGGQIYDPKNGSDYSCEMALTDANTLEVRGFIGVSLFGRTDVWKRQVAKK
mgnify:CR=1 FL=1